MKIGTIYNEIDNYWPEQSKKRWIHMPFYACFDLKKRAYSTANNKQVLSLSYGRIIVKPQEKLHGLVPESFETYQGIESADIIIRATDLQNDKTSIRVGISDYYGIITSAYLCYSTRQSIDPMYGFWYLRVIEYSKLIYGLGSGLRQNLSYDSLKRMPVYLPDKDEQEQIIRYLNYKNSQINKYIHIKKRQIGLLKELLDTKIEQLVDILNSDTSHQFRLKSILRSKIKDGPHETPEFMSTGIPFLSVDGIQNGELKFEGCRFISEIAHNRFKQKVVVERDDILLGKAASTGKVARVKVDFEFSVWSPLAVIKVKKSIALPEFVEFMLQSCYCQNQIYTLCTSNTQRNISMDDIPKVKLPIPNMETQFSIIEEISKLKKDINAQVNILENQINLMHEFKTRLISDVVTGKLDVRHLEVYNLLETDTQDGFEDMTGGELEETDANN